MYIDTLNLQLPYKQYIIEVFDDQPYDPDSADNINTYDRYYSGETDRDYIVNQYGIRITWQSTGQLIGQVCIAATGGSTAVHAHSAVLQNDHLAICCGDTVFCLSLPDLSLLWQTRVDSATSFEIFKCHQDLIVHGEVEITRLNSNGNIVWQFSGSDIFTTPTGKDVFRITEGIVYATNWDNVTFELDAVTGELLRSDTSNAEH